MSSDMEGTGLGAQGAGLSQASLTLGLSCLPPTHTPGEGSLLTKGSSDPAFQKDPPHGSLSCSVWDSPGPPRESHQPSGHHFSLLWGPPPEQTPTLALTHSRGRRKLPGCGPVARVRPGTRATAALAGGAAVLELASLPASGF